MIWWMAGSVLAALLERRLEDATTEHGSLIVEMNPRDFLRLTSTPADRLPRPDNVVWHMQQLEEKGRLPKAWLELERNARGELFVSAHDGRHRAKASIESGVDRFVVEVNLVDEWGDWQPLQLSQRFTLTSQAHDEEDIEEGLLLPEQDMVVELSS